MVDDPVGAIARNVPVLGVILSLLVRHLLEELVAQRKAHVIGELVSRAKADAGAPVARVRNAGDGTRSDLIHVFVEQANS